MDLEGSGNDMKIGTVFALLLISSVGWAGPGSSGGGPGISCPGPDGKIATVEMVDLYEGRIRFGLDIPESDQGAPTQILERISTLAMQDPYIGHDFETALILAMQ